MSILEIPTARVFQPLLVPARYKGAYGGRGSGKSHFFGEGVVERCVEIPGSRIVCVREVQKSLKESVKLLIEDKIRALGVSDRFHVLDKEIRGPGNGIVLFQGMHDHTAESVKSLEGFNVAYVEEAQTLSARSLELLRPTIRAPGSEMWFSWNPRHRTDPVDRLFRKNPPPDAISVQANWRDNPWFPDELDRDRRHDMETDPEIAEHVWEGGYGHMHGSILARLVDRAEAEGRLKGAEYDADGPGIEISSDIGFRDTASWWFWQRRIGGCDVLLHDADHGLDADDWCDRLKDILDTWGWKLGTIWLPKDAEARTFQSRHSALERFIKRFSGKRVKIVQRTSISDRINAGRRMIKSCRFDDIECEEGLEALRAWEFEKNPETQAFSKTPKHNWASHPGDAFTYGCQAMLGLEPPLVEEPKPLKGLSGVTMERVWKDQERRNRGGRARI